MEQQTRRWNVAEPHAQADALAERLRTSPMVAQLLLNRGLADADACRDFLTPSLKFLHEPAAIPNLLLAADRIAKAIRDGEKLVIYGDYDVDGITATAILWHAIRQLGGTAVETYIPHRIEEGYGLNADAVKQLCENGAKLIITVDCGVTAIGPAGVAREHGVDLIITDHHEGHGGNEGNEGNDECRMMNAQWPDCFAIVHPRLVHHSSPGAQSSPYPNPHLCGAGVAFKLAWAIGMAMSGANRVSESFRAFLMEATALAALGTIADVVPLVGENRVLAHFGLGAIKSSQLTGIRALIKSAGIEGQKLDSYHVGFLLGPRLNACGRMGHARMAVEMLTDAGAARAQEIAIFLEQQNRQRQTIERAIRAEAIEQTQQLGLDQAGNHAIVLGSKDWHPGVIGIVASRIVERFHRPAILVALAPEHGQGSGRSISGFHLARALETCGEHLEAFGGHEMAAGLKVKPENFERFRAAFLDHARSAIAPEQLVPELRLDCLAELKHVTEALVNDLKRLAPFGHGNRKPILCCRSVELAAPPRRVGKTGDHLQLFVRQGNTRMKCIAFNKGELFDRLTPGITIDLAVEPQINEFNGRISVELEVKDLQFA